MMTLFGSTKIWKDKTNDGENALSFEVAEVVLFQCNLVDNQYQKKSEVLYNFTLLILFLFFKCWTRQFSVFENLNTEFDEIIITFTDQNGTLLEIEVRVIAAY